MEDYPPASYFPQAENEAEVARSEPVAALVKEDLKIEQNVDELRAPLSAQPTSPTSKVISITYQSSDPEFARDAANSFAKNYLQYRRTKLEGALTSSAQSIRNQITEINRQLERVSAELERARAAGDTAALAELDTKRGSLSTQLGILQADLNALRGGTAQVTVGSILGLASVPTDPVSPDHVRNGLLGALIGILFGVGLAFLRERLDDRFKGRPDVERAIESPVLATVPRFSAGGRRGATELPTATDPRGPASEAYRNLRTGLQFLAQQRSAKSFLITSPSAHEGKTSTVANLGIALSQTGRRTVLVSADLRRPQIEKVFGAESDVGLSSWLLGDVDTLEQIVFEHPDLPFLSLLPAGPIPSNPAELLTSPRIGELITLLERAFDMVIFDSPPVLPVADSVILASHVDGVVLIFDAASTRRSAAIHAKEQIERVGGHVVGCVLNAFDPSTTPYYYEPYYYSGYSPADEDGDQDDGRPTGSSEGLDLVRDSRSIR